MRNGKLAIFLMVLAAICLGSPAFAKKGGNGGGGVIPTDGGGGVGGGGPAGNGGNGDPVA